MKRYNAGANRGNKMNRQRGLRGGTFGPAGPATIITATDPPDTWRVIGANCPWNTTPGTRQVWHNDTPVHEPAKRKYDQKR